MTYRSKDLQNFMRFDDVRMLMLENYSRVVQMDPAVPDELEAS